MKMRATWVRSKRKQIDVSPLISHVFSLDRIEQAMDYATTYKDSTRKVCVKF